MKSERAACSRCVDAKQSWPQPKRAQSAHGRVGLVEGEELAHAAAVVHDVEHVPKLLTDKEWGGGGGGGSCRGRDAGPRARSDERGRLGDDAPRSRGTPGIRVRQHAKGGGWLTSTSASTAAADPESSMITYLRMPRGARLRTRPPPRPLLQADPNMTRTIIRPGRPPTIRQSAVSRGDTPSRGPPPRQPSTSRIPPGGPRRRPWRWRAHRSMG